MTKSMQFIKGLYFKIAVFAVINVGISLIWKACLLIFPSEAFHSVAAFLILIVLVSALNLSRILQGNHLRAAYAIIAVLNVVTTVGVGNSAFLMSMGTIFRVVRSLISRLFEHLRFGLEFVPLRVRSLCQWNYGVLGHVPLPSHKGYMIAWWWWNRDL